MSTTITTFDVVKYQRTKKGKCACGKQLTRSRTFNQTINPYNRDKDGNVKSRNCIHVELVKEADEWQPEFVCKQCLDSKQQNDGRN